MCRNFLFPTLFPDRMQIDLEKLAQFIVDAKKQTYAGDGIEASPERSGFKELEYSKGNWAYRDSYTGYYMAPGQEIVRFEGKPVWAMAYSGGMLPEYQTDKALAKLTFSFLKQALNRVETASPYRGPSFYKNEEWIYLNDSEGNITDFFGTEHVFYNGLKVFRQRYIGGIVMPK
jgi:hypothetical protein